MKALLDPHILVHWISASVPLSSAHREVIESASDEEPLWVSDITLWEIATLESVGRIELDLPLRDWLERATAPAAFGSACPHHPCGRSRGCRVTR